MRAAVMSAIAVQGVLLWSAYPYPIAAYNPLLGGAAGAQQVMMIGWGEGLEQVAAYLNRQPDAERLAASTLYHHALRPFSCGKTERIVEPRSPNYVVVYINMAQRDLAPPELGSLIAGRMPEFTARINVVEYAWVHRVPRGLPTTAPGHVPGQLPEDDEPDDVGS